MRPATLMVIGAALLLLSSVPTICQPESALPAFPGAEGFGSTTPGGRGGQVIYVTNLNDSGPGSFRDAIYTRGPRTILFKVSGVIHLEKTIRMGGGWDPQTGDNPYSNCTIAGQSSPGGITISGKDLIIENAVHDVIVRHVRFRDSDDNCILIYTGAHDIIFDHCSFSWSTDENLDFADNTHDITISYCTIGEGLIEGGHVKGAHSMGALMSHGSTNISMHHNFWTGNNGRNPQITGANIPKWIDLWLLNPVLDFRNNIVYNYGWGTNILTGAYANVVGNFYAHGPDTPPQVPAINTGYGETDDDGSRLYVADNLGPHLDAAGDPWSMVAVGGRSSTFGTGAAVYGVSEPFPVAPVTTVPASEVVETVLGHSGAMPYDETDLRWIEEFRTGTGSLGAPARTHASAVTGGEAPEAPADTDGDGIPDEWETARGLDPMDAADGSHIAEDGYSNLEHYLNSIYEDKSTALPSFPGAEGWGATTPGGRGGQVIAVTNLSDSGPGSLRAAVETLGPRTIVFRVSGVINLTSPIYLSDAGDPASPETSHSFVTIAGQSAPGGGIVISGREFIITNNVHDVIIRGIRFRAGGDHPIILSKGAHNVVFDHCSWSWGFHENLDMSESHDITFSYCIFAEGLHDAMRVTGVVGHSGGLVVARSGTRLTIHHTYFTGNELYNPAVAGGMHPRWDAYEHHPVYDMRNCVVYNYGEGTNTNVGATGNIVGSVFTPGPGTAPTIAGIMIPPADDGTQLYVAGNLGANLNAEGDPWSMVGVWGGKIGGAPEYCRAQQPFEAPPITMTPTDQVIDVVLAQAGALPHDSVDARLAQELRDGTGDLGATCTHIWDQPVPAPEPGQPAIDTDGDGMPDEWETAHGLDPIDATDGGLISGDGYTNLEEYLNGIYSM